MRDEECVQFLQWALPRMHMRWAGFRKVRAQVCNRINRRLKQLGIEEINDYRQYLEKHVEEWKTLDVLSRVIISRFYRDKLMFAFLEQEVLPKSAQQVIARGDQCLKVWCIGFGTGEEPYTIMLIWRLQLQPRFPDLKLQILATDANPEMRRRAKEACYSYGSIKNLPEHWRQKAFVEKEKQFCLKAEYKQNIQFKDQDVREDIPKEEFDLVLCRNLVFTYFEEDQQREILERIKKLLQTEAALVVGIHEHLPEDSVGFEVWSDRLKVYKKVK